jgi:hypothetical protein
MKYLSLCRLLLLLRVKTAVMGQLHDSGKKKYRQKPQRRTEIEAMVFQNA